jgi:hypothetical protein
MTNIKLLAVAALLLIGCGDNKSVVDAREKDSSGPADAYCSNCPAAPTVGAQIDRMGRPAVNTVLNNGFNPDQTTAQPAKTAYNQNADVASWFATANLAEFAKNLALVDALDTTATGTGCGNQAMYNGTGMGAAMPTSYFTLATVLANDQLFLDTGKPMCAFYLAAEFGAVTGAYSTCGGRMPQYDVVDFSYSMLASGVGGFDITATAITPKVTDGVPAHTDYLADFPYLGNPN